MSDFDFESAPSSSSAFTRGLANWSPDNPPPYLSSLNERQKEAVLAVDGPLIVLAGAGSGKTKMLTSRIAYLIQACRVPGYRILAVTFTNKAANEMRERVAKFLDGDFGIGLPEIGTFHAVCVRLLRREMIHTKFTKPFVIYDDSDQLSLIKRVVHKLGIDDKAFSPKMFQGRINRLKCDAVEPEEYEPEPHDIPGRQCKRVYLEYQRDLITNNALDFGEIICMTYRLLRDNEEVRRKYQQRFQFIHVDEYQDTNRSQYLLLSTLAGKKSGGHQNICVVGDEDQSIYKWRGADIRNILDFEQDYPGARVVKLEQNYRSTKTIIDAAASVIRNNRERKEKTLWTSNEQGLPIIRFQVPDERAEAEKVVSEIRRLSTNEGYSFKDFSIFYRTHAQSRQFEDVFRRDRIPYQIVGGLRFYDRKEIKDVLSYFKVVMNPADSVSLRRVINVPARGIGKTTLERLDELQNELERAGAADASFWAVLLQVAGDPSLTSPSVSRKIGAFVALVQKLISEQPKILLTELYHLILDETGYVRELRKEGTDEAQARVENLEEFDTLLQEFEEDVREKNAEMPKTELLMMFLEQSALVSEEENSHGPEQSAIHLMTLHSSKGLEYPVVFLVGMEEGLFPSVRPWEETPDEDIEEERRLCYVGMTRARERLYLLNAMIRRLWGNVTYQEPARFFTEMPDHFIEFHDLSYAASAGGFRQGSSRQQSQQRFDDRYDDEDDVPTPAIPPARKPTTQTLIGRKIRHPEYGLGTIISAEGSGQDQKVMIEFPKRNQRKFLFRYVEQYLDGNQ